VKFSIDGLNKIFESRIKLGVMSALAANGSLDFNALKEFFDVTDGNLASHLKSLEKESYISVQKSFIGRKPNTSYSITNQGRLAFEEHLSALEQLINSHK
jgi:DNA-binding MarR family transcriptional regulator